MKHWIGPSMLLSLLASILIVLVMTPQVGAEVVQQTSPTATVTVTATPGSFPATLHAAHTNWQTFAVTVTTEITGTVYGSLSVRKNGEVAQYAEIRAYVKPGKEYLLPLEGPIRLVDVSCGDRIVFSAFFLLEDGRNRTYGFEQERSCKPDEYLLFLPQLLQGALPIPSRTYSPTPTAPATATHSPTPTITPTPSATFRPGKWCEFGAMSYANGILSLTFRWNGVGEGSQQLVMIRKNSSDVTHSYTFLNTDSQGERVAIFFVEDGDYSLAGYIDGAHPLAADPNCTEGYPPPTPTATPTATLPRPTPLPNGAAVCTWDITPLGRTTEGREFEVKVHYRIDQRIWYDMVLLAGADPFSIRFDQQAPEDTIKGDFTVYDDSQRILAVDLSQVVDGHYQWICGQNVQIGQ